MTQSMRKKTTPLPIMFAQDYGAIARTLEPVAPRNRTAVGVGATLAAALMLALVPGCHEQAPAQDGNQPVEPAQDETQRMGGAIPPVSPEPTQQPRVQPSVQPGTTPPATTSNTRPSIAPPANSAVQPVMTSPAVPGGIGMIARPTTRQVASLAAKTTKR